MRSRGGESREGQKHNHRRFEVVVETGIRIGIRGRR